MNIEKFYEDIHSNYEIVLKRLGTRDLVIRFVDRFKEDKTYDKFVEAYNNNDVENAFLAIHTLKGLCINFGFTELEKASVTLTEILRKRTFDGSKEAYEEVVQKYNEWMKAYNDNK